MNEFAQPYCRLCQHQLKATAGCATCLPVKKCIQWPILHDEEESVMTAKGLSQESAKMFKRQVRRLKTLERTQDEPNPCEACGKQKIGYRSDITKEMVQLNRAIKETVGEIRKLEDRDEAQYSALTFEARVKLFVEQFYCNLPEEHQRDMLALMQRVSEAQAAKLPQLPSNADE